MKRFIRENFMYRKGYCLLKSVCFCLTMIVIIGSTAAAKPENKKITVMSRNLYVGADIFTAIDAAVNNPSDVPIAVAEIFQTIQYTDFPERAQSIADEIERWQPDLIGLQEVSEILEQVPGDYLYGNQMPAEDVVYDYLSILLEALEERGLCYEVAQEVTDADVELPMLAGFTEDGYPKFNDVRLIDHDVILVRKGVEVEKAVAGNFSTNIIIPTGITNIELTRGYIIVEVKVDQRRLRFVNTHLELGDGPDNIFSVVQSAQMHELLTILAGEDKPTILLGDLNSTPEETPIDSDYGPIIPPYMQAVSSGYTDIFSMPKKLPGPTCCFNETLDDPDASLDTRIDHIFISDSLDIKKTKPRTIGDKEKDMTPSGLWPSDHAGVIGTIKF